MDQTQISGLLTAFVDRLLVLPADVDPDALLAPGNLIITPEGIGFVNPAPPKGPPRIYPGYTAPEGYRRPAGEPGRIYLIGAVGSLMLTGAPPPDARSRPVPMLMDDSPLAGVLNRATSPDPAARYPSLAALREAFAEVAAPPPQLGPEPELAAETVPEPTYADEAPLVDAALFEAAGLLPAGAGAAATEAEPEHVPASEVEQPPAPAAPAEPEPATQAEPPPAEAQLEPAWTEITPEPAPPTPEPEPVWTEITPAPEPAPEPQAVPVPAPEPEPAPAPEGEAAPEPEPDEAWGVAEPAPPQLDAIMAEVYEAEAAREPLPEGKTPYVPEPVDELKLTEDFEAETVYELAPETAASPAPPAEGYEPEVPYAPEPEAPLPPVSEHETVYAGEDAPEETPLGWPEATAPTDGQGGAPEGEEAFYTGDWVPPASWAFGVATEEALPAMGDEPAPPAGELPADEPPADDAPAAANGEAEPFTGGPSAADEDAAPPNAEPLTEGPPVSDEDAMPPEPDAEPLTEGLPATDETAALPLAEPPPASDGETVFSAGEPPAGAPFPSPGEGAEPAAAESAVSGAPAPPLDELYPPAAPYTEAKAVPPPSAPRPYQPPEGGAPAQPWAATPPPPKKKKAHRKALIIAGVVVVGIALAVGIFFGVRAIQNARLNTAWAAGDYAAVVDIADNAAYLQAAHPQAWRYSSARVHEAAGQSDEALALYAELGEFEDSAERADALRYADAMGFLESGHLDKAADLFGQLGRYEDSPQMLESVQQYQWAASTADPLARYQAFLALGDFLDSPVQAEAAAGDAYDAALLDYTDGFLYLANDAFEALGDYKDGPVYLAALGEWMAADLGLADPGDAVAAILAYEDQVDLGPLLLSDACFLAWLEGSWTSDDGGGRLNIGQDTFQFTAFDHRGQYSVEPPALVPSGEEESPTFTFEYAGPNEVRVTVSDDGATYHFTRGE